MRGHVRQERGRHRIRPEDNPKKTLFTGPLRALGNRCSIRLSYDAVVSILQDGVQKIRAGVHDVEGVKPKA